MVNTILEYRPITVLRYISAFGTIYLWFYCIHFYYKYDRYSKNGLKLWILFYLYAPIYFYKVIWKRKRPLENTIKNEPVLGNKIHLISEEEKSNQA
jgi:hypothetical protein